MIAVLDMRMYVSLVSVCPGVCWLVGLFVSNLYCFLLQKDSKYIRIVSKCSGIDACLDINALFGYLCIVWVLINFRMSMQCSGVYAMLNVDAMFRC